jgi:hypothetical protein
MPEVPARFSVATVWQAIPHAVLAEIDGFMRVFDRIDLAPPGGWLPTYVETRRTWHARSTRARDDCVPPGSIRR